MDGERAPKRARQACLNCRRKKTRCSGEMPVCSFCARLSQPCIWDGDQERVSWHRNNFFNTPDSALAARVALLESKLSELGAAGTSGPAAPLTGNAATSTLFDGGRSIDGNEMNPPTATSTYETLPAKPALSRLIDVYFAHCYSQPYVYFHEATFRQRFEDGVLPDSLLFALAATACRFSNEPPYGHMSSAAVASYASAAWVRIFEQSFSYEGDLDLTVVQALSMLAVIDFTAGHPRQGWVKVALGVRFAQALRLNEEPEPDLPAWEREERRRTFWSMYLLDRLISLGPNRPPSFSDDDCTVHLPSSDEAFLGGTDDQDMPILTSIIDDPRGLQYQKLDYFALTTVMACTLGRFIRYSLKRALVEKFPPWDSRSSYTQIHSMLLHYETSSPFTYGGASQIIQNQLSHQHRLGHLIFSQALFHLNYCLLNHPFILYHHFRSSATPIPLSFARETLQRSFFHAGKLLDLIQDAQDNGRFAESSFFGYCAMVPGIIFRLYEQGEDPSVAEVSRERVAATLEYLERRPTRWQFHPIMASILRSFAPSAEMASSLVNPIKLAQRTEVIAADQLWSLIDYAALQGNFRRTESPVATTIPNPLSRTELGQYELRPQTLMSPNGPDYTNDSYWMGHTDIQQYLGADMGGLWGEVFHQPHIN